MKLWTKIKFGAALLLAVALGGGAFYFGYQTARRGATRTTLNSSAVLQQIQNLSELVSVQYRIQKVIGLEEEKVPFGSEKIVLMVQASVLGGVDLAALTTQQVICAGNRVTVRLPPAKVLHVFVNDKETRVWDRTKTWWTPWVPFSPDLEQKARQAALEAMQAAARDMGILTNAQRNAEHTIREFLQKTVGAEAVAFQVAP
jgi:hypothetical protein